MGMDSFLLYRKTFHHGKQVGDAVIREPRRGGGEDEMFLLKSGRIPCPTLPDAALH